MAKHKIFVVEDDEWYRELLTYNISLNPDYEVRQFSTGKDCLNSLSDEPMLITLDYRLPDMDGETVLKEIKKYNKSIEVIIISEQEKIETAIDLLKKGAYDYLVKTKDIRDRLLNVVNNVSKQANLQKRVDSLQQEVEKKYEFENSIIGNSDPMKKVFSLLEKASQTNITVTVTGETGTGKELVAKAIHYHSLRKKQSFVPVNMSAIPKDLMESELFGHERGSFTGASATRIGRFEEANKGTIFLDEIGELDLSLQAKLLRVLQEKEVTRVGSNRAIKTDSRIIVATHKNLQQIVKNGSFREDLYFRLFGLNIHLPPLRERENDILLCARHFTSSFCKENGIEIKSLSKEAQKKLMGYHYPGNVRELRSVIELAIVMADTDVIESEDLSFGTDELESISSNHELTLKEHTRHIIKAYLKKCNNNVKQAADKLDIGFSTIYRVLKEDQKDR